MFVTTHYMDEAERCHRVALMHHGQLLALGPIDQLKKIFPAGTVIEVECEEAARALDAVESAPGVSDAALFGDALHVVVGSPAEGRALEQHLVAAGFGSASVRAVPPSLEDVFIRVIREADRERVA